MPSSDCQPSAISEDFRRGKSPPQILGKSVTPPRLLSSGGKPLTNVEGVQVGQPRGGLLQQGDGLQAEVGEVFLLHVLQETRGSVKVHSLGTRPLRALCMCVCVCVSLSLSYSFFKSDSILFRKMPLALWY